jgi:hypothetical protein
MANLALSGGRERPPARCRAGRAGCAGCAGCAPERTSVRGVRAREDLNCAREALRRDGVSRSSVAARLASARQAVDTEAAACGLLRGGNSRPRDRAICADRPVDVFAIARFEARAHFSGRAAGGPHARRSRDAQISPAGVRVIRAPESRMALERGRVPVARISRAVGRVVRAPGPRAALERDRVPVARISRAAVRAASG